MCATDGVWDVMIGQDAVLLARVASTRLRVTSIRSFQSQLNREQCLMSYGTKASVNLNRSSSFCKAVAEF